jgi:hypothetical protein
MVAFLRVVTALPVILFSFTIHLRAQDMPVRVEAVRLMERANAVSRSARIMPNYKVEGTFRAYGLDGAVRSGTFNTIYSVDSERYEIVFGNYHAIGLHFPDRIARRVQWKTGSRRRSTSCSFSAAVNAFAFSWNFYVCNTRTGS